MICAFWDLESSTHMKVYFAYLCLMALFYQKHSLWLRFQTKMSNVLISLNPTRYFMWKFNELKARVFLLFTQEDKLRYNPTLRNLYERESVGKAVTYGLSQWYLSSRGFEILRIMLNVCLQNVFKYTLCFQTKNNYKPYGCDRQCLLSPHLDKSSYAYF